MPSDNSEIEEANNLNELPVAEDTVENSEQNSTAPAQTVAQPRQNKPTVSGSYEAMIESYAYRIQFVECHGTATYPGMGTLIVKKNVKFMLDNRDKEAHTFAFAGQSHRVGGLGWLIASVDKAGTYNITCDGGGAATLTIED